jgi:hypothetical protein
VLQYRGEGCSRLLDQQSWRVPYGAGVMCGTQRFNSMWRPFGLTFTGYAPVRSCRSGTLVLLLIGGFL